MPKYRDTTTTKDLRETINLSAKKSLGQHFLLDQNLTDKIAKVAIEPHSDLSDYTIIEIGPGPGGLTRSILKHKPKHLYVIERDERFMDSLEKLCQLNTNKLTTIIADALELSISNIGKSPRRIIANLPYNISTTLLINWLRQVENIEQMTLMFQREVADRIIAQPSSKAYGRISVITQWLCE